MHLAMERYYPPKARHYKTKGNAQDAHEAIRPSDVTLVPDEIKKDLTSEQYRLYKLIWSRFLACQMASAVYDSLSIEVENSGYTFRASHSALKFSGFTAVYEEGRDDDGEEGPQSPLPDLKEGEPLALKDTSQEQHFTQPPARYSEASLIRALEEKGIGRPSTYAPTISTILNREYVVKELSLIHILAAQLGLELARNGVLLVSGIAQGIDSIALKGALQGGGRVVPPSSTSWSVWACWRLSFCFRTRYGASC